MRQHQPTAEPAELKEHQAIFFRAGLDFHSDGKVEIVAEEAMSALVEGMRATTSVALSLIEYQENKIIIVRL